MNHVPERTCIGCRGLFKKDQVVRIVAGPEGPVADYREKLPGRAAYVCPKRDCIEKAINRDNLSRALRVKVKPQAVDEFVLLVVSQVTEKIRSLIAMAAKAGKLAAGYSAVRDSLEKNRVELVVYATDISDGTKEKLSRDRKSGLREITLFTREQIGGMLSRELVGVVAVTDKGLADAVWNEAERLKSLININE